MLWLGNLNSYKTTTTKHQITSIFIYTLSSSYFPVSIRSFAAAMAVEKSRQETVKSCVKRSLADKDVLYGMIEYWKVTIDVEEFDNAYISQYHPNEGHRTSFLV